MSTQSLAAYSASVSSGNWAPAWTAAVTAAKATGGTINVDTDNRIDTFVALAVSGYTDYNQWNFVGNGGYKTTIKSDSSNVAFYLNGNAVATSFRDMNIVGYYIDDTGSSVTCHTLILAVGSERCVVERCVIAGHIATESLIHGLSSPVNLIIRDTSMSGNGAGTALVYAEGCDSLVMENVVISDYQNYRGQYYSHGSYPLSWIKAYYAGTPATSHIPMVRLVNVRTDEGTRFCDIDGYPSVEIIQCAMNANSVDPLGQIKIANAERVTIKDCWVGYPAQDVPAIELSNCGDVLIDGLKLAAGPHRVKVDRGTRLKIINSPGLVKEYT